VYEKVEYINSTNLVARYFDLFFNLDIGKKTSTPTAKLSCITFWMLIMRKYALCHHYASGVVTKIQPMSLRTLPLHPTWFVFLALIFFPASPST
jgi:hypothetical protein